MTIEYLAKPLPSGFRYNDGFNLIVPEKNHTSPIISITGHVDEKLTESVNNQLNGLRNRTDTKSVDVNLSSLGGSVYYGFAIHDLLAVFGRKQNVDINITAFGPVQSMGVLILQAGSKRAMSTNAEMLIHPFWKKTDSPVFIDTLEADVAQTKKMNLKYYKILAERSQVVGGKLTPNDVRKMALARQNSGTFIGSEKALKLKLIDEIV